MSLYSTGCPRQLQGAFLLTVCLLLCSLPGLWTNSGQLKAAAIQTGQISPEEQTFTLTGEQTVHLLLIGRDREEPDGSARSDAIMLCTIRKDRGQLILTSFLRDLYIEIPGHGKNRLNAAYALGGRELLCQTLHHNFGISPDAVVEADFSGFRDIVDTLGGVLLTLRQEEADAISKSAGTHLTAGAHLLNGQEALAYVRLRKVDGEGDFGRTARQQQLLTAILNSCRDGSIPALLSLARKLLPLAESDISRGALLRLMLEALPLLSQLQISGQQIPQAEDCTYATVRGMSVLLTDPDAVRKHIQKTLLDTVGNASPGQ